MKSFGPVQWVNDAFPVFIRPAGRADADHREVSVGLRKSEAVALGHPVVPVADGFLG
jgi:hypothetical protein